MKTRALPFLAALALMAGCSGSATLQPGPLGNGPVTATINGQSWTSNATAGAIRQPSGLYSLTALGPSADYTLIFALHNIGGTGTFPLGTLPMLTGGTVVVSKVGSPGWSTPLNGLAGQISITTLTATRMVGTFSFTAAPLTGTGVLTVTSGTFDVPVTGTAPFAALPDNIGGRFAATVAGVASGVNGVSSILTTGAAPTLTIVAGGERTINISLANMTGAATYILSAATPARSIQVTGSGTSQTATWYSQGQGGTGTVTITSATASRIVGSFSATLVPLAGGAAGLLTVSGTFDFGRGLTF